MTSKNNLTFVTFYQYLLQNYVCVVRYQRQIVIRRIIQMEVLCKEDALIDTKRFLTKSNGKLWHDQFVPIFFFFYTHLHNSPTQSNI